MTDDQQVTHGVDIDELDGVAEYASEHPDEVQLGLGTRSTDGGTWAHGPAKADSYTLVSLARDVEFAPSRHGGSGRRVTR